MALKIKTKILLGSTVLVVASSLINIGVASFAVDKNLTTDLVNRIVLNTKSEIDDLTNYVLIGDKESIVSLIYNQKASHRDLAYMFVLDENGNLIASTIINKDPEKFVKYNILQPGQNEKVNLITQDDGREVYDIALHLNYSKGTLRAGYYKSQIDTSILNIIYLLIFGTGVAVIINFLLAWLFTKSFFKPLESLRHAVEKITSGDLHMRAKVITNDEFGFLATSFNKMVDDVEQSYKVLEDKVKDRTSELDQKVDELKRMNNLMVDREVKMVELKNKIKYLEAAKS